MKIKLDTKKIYLAMAERGITATKIAKNGGVSQQAIWWRGPVLFLLCS